MRDLDLPRGEDRELVIDRDRVYELNGEGSRRLAVVGAFGIVPEQDLDTGRGTLDHLRCEGLVETVDLAATRAVSPSRRRAVTCPRGSQPD